MSHRAAPEGIEMGFNPYVIALDQLSRNPGEVRRRQRQGRRPHGVRTTRRVPGQRSR